VRKKFKKLKIIAITQRLAGPKKRFCWRKCCSLPDAEYSIHFSPRTCIEIRL